MTSVCSFSFSSAMLCPSPKSSVDSEGIQLEVLSCLRLKKKMETTSPKDLSNPIDSS